MTTNTPAAASTVSTPAWVDRKEWPFEDRWLRLPGGNLHYVDVGPRGAEAIVLVHGTPSWSWEWRAVIKALAVTRRVIAFDHLGFGLSDKPVGWTYRLSDHTRNLLGLLGHLGLERYSLVVHDVGGVIALPLAVTEPMRVRRLAIVNSWIWPLSDVDRAFRFMAPVMGSALMRWLYLEKGFSARVMLKSAWGQRRPLTPVIHAPYLAPLADRVARQGTVGFLEAVTALDLPEWQLWRKVEAMKDIPTTIVWGMADRFLHGGHLNRWRNLAPWAQVIELAGVGHFPAEEAPDETAEMLAVALG